MRRALLTVAFVVTLVLAVPSFASPANDVIGEPSSPAALPTTGMAVPAAPPQGVIPKNMKAETGEVVLSTPDELMLRTAKGLEKFEVTRQTQMFVGGAEGDEVTVFYRTPATNVGGNAAGSAQVTSRSHTRVAGLAVVVTPRAGGVAGR